ncbi:MAG: PDZ domain-containing protein [Planctomycetota bacterium]
MNRLRIAILAIASCTLACCRTTHHLSVSDHLHEGVLLAEHDDEDGGRQQWRVYPGRSDDPRIDVTESKVELVARIGLSVSPVTRQRAEESDIEPWRGVWVDQANRGQPAARAGLVTGDVILNVAGNDVTSAEQFADLVTQHAIPGEPLDLQILGNRRRGDPPGERPVHTVVLEPESVEVRDSRTDSVALEASPGIQRYTGLQIATAPSEIARRVWGEASPVPIVTGVITGSPAYRAGLRSGDRVVRCDGRPLNSLQELRDAVRRRVVAKLDGAPLFDLATMQDAPAGSNDAEPISLEVTGPLGPHFAELEVTGGLDTESRLHIPIIVNHRSRLDSSRTSFLDFIFQFGFSHRRRTLPSASRAPVETSELSLFPLGMFEFKHGVHRNEYTLFWLITFGSDR